MKLGFASLLSIAALGCSARPDDRSLDGRWKGSAFAFGDSAPLIVDFRSGEGSLRAWVTMTAEAMLRDKPLQNVRVSGSNLHMELSNHSGARAVFNGEVSRDIIEGNFVKGENVVRVRLLRTGDIPAPSYHLDRVAFRSSDGAILRGTLFVPPGIGPHPAVVLIHGSGPSDRTDFNYLADVFARHGIAALSYDKRGAGESGGDALHATLATLAEDARGAIAALIKRPDIRDDAIGLCGVSEGGWVAPIVASVDTSVAFVIAVVPPGDRYDANRFYQISLRLRAARASDAQVERYVRAMESVGAIVRARRRGGTDASLEDRARSTQLLLDSLNQQPIFDVADLPRVVPSGETLRRFRWANLDFDPYPYWKKVSRPVLVVLGGKDRNLDSNVSLRRIARALNENSNHRASFLVYDEANHDLMVPGAGPGLRFPVPAPKYPDTLARWAVGTISGRAQR